MPQLRYRPLSISNFVLTLGLIAACSDPMGKEQWRFSVEIDAVQAVSLDGIPPVRLDAVFSLAGLSDVQAISPAVALDSATIVLAGQRGCTVYAVVPASQRVLWKVGQCGEGPGEFRSISAIAVHGDSIAVVDNELSRLTFLNRKGEFVQAVPFADSIVEPGRRVQSMGFLSSGEAVFSLFTPSNGKQPSPWSLLAATGASTLLPRVSHPLSYELQKSSVQMGYPMCVSPDGTTLYMVNRWGPELLVIQGERSRSVRLPFEGIREVDLATKANPSRPVIPSAVGVGVACGDHVVAVGYVVSDSGTPMTYRQSHHLLLPMSPTGRQSSDDLYSLCQGPMGRFLGMHDDVLQHDTLLSVYRDVMQT